MFEQVINAHGTKIQKVNKYTIKCFSLSLYPWALNPLPQKQRLLFIYVYLHP